TRRHFLQVTAAGATAGGVLPGVLGAVARGDAGSRPNIVLIYTDDQDLDEIGCYGGRMPTPHMDGLARDGVLFRRYYTCSAVCSPSRYNALGGRCASRSLKQQGTKFLPGGPVNIGWEAGVINEPHTIGSVLKAAGYTTGMVGKWHQGQLEPMHGFPAAADPTDPKVRAQLEGNYDILVRSVRSCGFDYADALYANNVDGGSREKPFWIPRALGFHNMEWVTACALTFLDQAAAADSAPRKPFFLYLAPTLVHGPSAVASLKADARITSRGYVDIPTVMPSRASVLERAGAAMGKGPRGRVNDKAAGSIWMDDGVGAVLARLDALGLRENTLVLLASDNGNVAKFTCYDGGARLPFVARWPGAIPAGSVCDKLVSNLDFAPTAFELAGADVPAAMVLDGQSILGALRGDPGYRRESVFLEITTERAVVTDDGFKYIAVRYLPDAQKAVDRGERHNHWCQPMDKSTHSFNAENRYPAYFDQDQLYNLNTDPEEQKNLAGNPAFADRLTRLKALLRTYSATLPHTFGEFTGQ
ncbi:MAG: sulfatase-like hydrolase/transferase, partial [Lentisphaeria bacterium]|nr:sulfatase-like hydrolase/transferase [Lentisphaeria bacterium]